MRQRRGSGRRIRASGLFWAVLIVLAGASLISGQMRSGSNSSQSVSHAPQPVQTSSDGPTSATAPAPAPVAAIFHATHRTTANVLRLRASPAADGEILDTLAIGTEVALVTSNGAWGAVQLHDGRKGWVSLQYLQPAANEPLQLLTPAAPPKQAKQSSPAPKAGDPLRAPYVGTCDCPYDRKRNGARCGGSSAYSRPGGRSPQCYVGD